MDPVRKLILEKLKEHDIEMSDASRQIGRNHAYLQQFLKRGVPVELKEKERIRLANLLEVPETALRGTSPPLPPKEYATPNSKPDMRTELSGSQHKPVDNHTQVSTTFGDRDLPVFGTAPGGSQGSLIMTSDAVDWVVRPDPLLRVRDGYGMIVSGDSMSDKIEHGEKVLVNPHLPPRVGDVCVFRKRVGGGPDHVLIKKVRHFTDDTWYVSQLRPKKDSTLKRSEWQAHVVVGIYFGR